MKYHVIIDCGVTIGDRHYRHGEEIDASGIPEKDLADLVKTGHVEAAHGEAAPAAGKSAKTAEKE